MIFSLESYAEDEILIRGTSENRKEASGTAEIDGSVVGKKIKPRSRDSEEMTMKKKKTRWFGLLGFDTYLRFENSVGRTNQSNTCREKQWMWK